MIKEKYTYQIYCDKLELLNDFAYIFDWNYLLSKECDGLNHIKKHLC